MTEPPEWALREAQDLVPHLALRTQPWTVEQEAAVIQRFALALADNRRRGMEEAEFWDKEAIATRLAALRKQVLELEEALRLTIISKEDALARATAENQKLRDELVGKRESWYTRALAAADRATKAEEGLREAAEAIRLAENVFDLIVAVGPENETARNIDDKLRATLARIKELLPP